MEEKMRMFLRVLSSKGVPLCCYSPFYAYIKECFPDSVPRMGLFSSDADLPEDVSLFLVLGGDGTFLSSLTVVRDSGIPVAGINFGRLGFLTAAKADGSGVGTLLDALLGGGFNIEKRSVLQVEAAALPPDFYNCALNEISIQRRDHAMLGIEVSVDGHRIPAYWADGLIVATPTGSTAYSLSVGGPVAAPSSEVFIITPIAPHNLNVRPLIVPDTSVVEVSIIPAGKTALMTADNRSAVIRADSGRIRVTRAPFPLNIASAGEESFFCALKEKLLWGEDKRNSRQ